MQRTSRTPPAGAPQHFFSAANAPYAENAELHRRVQSQQDEIGRLRLDLAESQLVHASGQRLLNSQSATVGVAGIIGIVGGAIAVYGGALVGGVIAIAAGATGLASALAFPLVNREDEIGEPPRPGPGDVPLDLPTPTPPVEQQFRTELKGQAQEG